MQINYVSIVKELNPEAYKDTVLGRQVTVYDKVGVFFNDPKLASAHQMELAVEDRGGVMLVTM